MHLPISVHDAPDLRAWSTKWPYEMVGDLAEGFGGEHRVGELIQRFGVHLLDDTDEVVEANGVGDLRWLGHAVNLRLTAMVVNPGLTLASSRADTRAVRFDRECQASRAARARK